MAQKYEGVILSRRQIFTNNLLGGFAWGIGATIGLAIFFAILGFIASRADLVPVVGSFVSQVLDFVIKKNGNL